MSEITEAIEERTVFNKTTIGFWIYLMTDCMLFASLFATFVVLRSAVAGGPGGREIFSMPLVLAETIILLTSSFSCGIALVSLKQRNVRRMVWSLAATYVLGIAFLTIEISEFTKLIGEGHGPQQSAFLTAFFTLVGTHGFHIFVGLIWLLTLACVLARKGLTSKLTRQLTLFGLFWHFLDLVWIFIFTVVYLMGVSV
jgi:cytochrome o ubiquinol oxidase subunit 3